MQNYLNRPSSSASAPSTNKMITKTPDIKSNYTPLTQNTVVVSSSSSPFNIKSALPSSSSVSTTAVSSTLISNPTTMVSPTTTKSTTTELKSAMAAVKAGGSSEASLASYMTATEGMTNKQKQAYLLKRRADEARLQQLRGIFATYDEDRDNELNEKELTLALLSLGFDPTPRTLQRFYLASPTGRVDLATVSIYSI